MKTILFVTLALTVGSSTAHAIDVAGSTRATAHFAAVSVTESQGVRTIISNVLAAPNEANASSCPVELRFFGPDGALIGEAKTVELRSGESTSVTAAHASNLVRVMVSVGDVADPAKACAIRTNLEVFDAQTGTTFVSVLGESIGADGGCRAPVAPAVGAPHKGVPRRVHQSSDSPLVPTLGVAPRNPPRRLNTSSDSPSKRGG